MMKKVMLFSLVLALGFVACDKEGIDFRPDKPDEGQPEITVGDIPTDLSCSDYALYLEERLAEIKNLATSVSCLDDSAWSYTAYGSKACGGPQGYIAYSLSLDTNAFLSLVETHRQAEEQFNQGCGVISDCSVPSEPKGVACENGEAVLVY